ncbi:LysR family transcriptional regulator [Agromyces sp. NPDC127015]|uniref:LysR family transcriptional regulator n=1 Tax=Agromyces sp. NPDC127015 TaxID=3347108 RepID=UPI003647420D
MDVELRHLRVLVALDEERSFTAAAARLGLSQAAVSRAIAALEHELGTPLVHRTTRRVEPTAAGAAFAGTARRLNAELDRAVAELRGERSRVRLGYSWAALGAHTTAVLRAWNRAHPDEPLRLSRINRRDAGLADGRVDLAVIRGDVRVPDVVDEVVGHERRYVAMPVDHELADRARVALADLTPFVVAVDRYTGTTTTSLWSDAGLEPPRITDTTAFEDWLDLIAAGEVIGVTAAATTHQYPRPGIVFADLTDAPPIEVHLAWHRSWRHPATTRLARAIREAYATGPLA